MINYGTYGKSNIVNMAYLIKCPIPCASLRLGDKNGRQTLCMAADENPA